VASHLLLHLEGYALECFDRFENDYQVTQFDFLHTMTEDQGSSFSRAPGKVLFFLSSFLFILFGPILQNPFPEPNIISRDFKSRNPGGF